MVLRVLSWKLKLLCMAGDSVVNCRHLGIKATTIFNKKKRKYYVSYCKARLYYFNDLGQWMIASDWISEVFQFRGSTIIKPNRTSNFEILLNCKFPKLPDVGVVNFGDINRGNRHRLSGDQFLQLEMHVEFVITMSKRDDESLKNLKESPSFFNMYL